MSKRVLLIIPTLGVGGAERAICLLSIELAKRGHQIWLCHFDNYSEPPFPYRGELISLSVTTGNGLLRKFVAFISRIRKLRKLKAILRIDVSISYLEGADFVNILSKRQDRIIVSIRSSKIYNESITGSFKWLRSRILIPMLYNKADYVVGIEENVANELIKEFHISKSKVTVIPNHYDISFIKSQSEEPLPITYTNKNVLIFCGRLVPVKGILEFISVFEQLKRKDGSYQLWVLGDGPLKYELIAKAVSLNLNLSESAKGNTSNVDIILFGNQRNPWKFVSKADLFIVSSYSESFGNAMAEAILLQIPVISTDCPYGPRRLLMNETATEFVPTTNPMYCKGGILMPLWGQDDNVIRIWVETIVYFFNHPKKSLDQNFINEFAKKYSTDRISSQWEILINETKSLNP
jgi:glycosyltransferase involved in cell wall biosynthesis